MSGADHDALRDAVFNAKTEAEFQAAQEARSAALWREVEQEMVEEELAVAADAALDAALASPVREGMSTAERDREIVDLYRRGASSCAIGERFGASASRVYQIAMRDAPELKTERGRGSKTMRRVRQRGAARATRREYPPRVLYLLRHPIGPLHVRAWSSLAGALREAWPRCADRRDHRAVQNADRQYGRGVP